MNHIEHPGDEVLVLGNEILKMLQDNLMESLETGLAKRWGIEWFRDCSILESRALDELKPDLQFILKQIVQKNNGNFRLALAETLFKEQRLSKQQLDALANIQKSRNAWAHPDSSRMTITLLRDLSNQILHFYGPLNNSLVVYCSFILSFQENDDEAIPKILANSVLFRRHIGKVDNLLEGITENANLLAQIIQLEDKLKKSPNQLQNTSGLIPGYESLTYEDLEGNLEFLKHSTFSLFKNYYYLNLIILGESFKMLFISKATAKNPEIKSLVSDFESKKSLEAVMGLFKEIQERLKDAENRLVIPEDCNCQWCSDFGSNIGMISEVSAITKVTERISEISRVTKKE